MTIATTSMEDSEEVVTGATEAPPPGDERKKIYSSSAKLAFSVDSLLSGPRILAAPKPLLPLPLQGGHQPGYLATLLACHHLQQSSGGEAVGQPSSAVASVLSAISGSSTCGWSVPHPALVTGFPSSLAAHLMGQGETFFSSHWHLQLDC